MQKKVEFVTVDALERERERERERESYTLVNKVLLSMRYKIKKIGVCLY